MYYIYINILQIPAILFSLRGPQRRGRRKGLYRHRIDPPQIIDRQTTPRRIFIDKIGCRIGNQELGEPIGPVLGWKGGKAIGLGLQGQSVGVRTGPDDVKSQVTGGGSTVGAQEIVALVNGEYARACDLSSGGLVLGQAVEIVGIFQAFGGATKDAAVVPSDELYHALFYFNNGGEKGKDLFLVGIKVYFEKGEGRLTGSPDGNDGTLRKDVAGGIPTQYQVIVGWMDETEL